MLAIRPAIGEGPLSIPETDDHGVARHLFYEFTT
jgi:hypothetical protein